MFVLSRIIIRQSFIEKPVYLMRPKSRPHILERLENGNWDIFGDIKKPFKF